MKNFLIYWPTNKRRAQNFKLTLTLRCSAGLHLYIAAVVAEASAAVVESDNADTAFVVAAVVVL